MRHKEVGPISLEFCTYRYVRLNMAIHIFDSHANKPYLPLGHERFAVICFIIQNDLAYNVSRIFIEASHTI